MSTHWKSWSLFKAKKYTVKKLNSSIFLQFSLKKVYFHIDLREYSIKGEGDTGSKEIVDQESLRIFFIRNTPLGEKEASSGERSCSVNLSWLRDYLLLNPQRDIVVVSWTLKCSAYSRLGFCELDVQPSSQKHWDSLRSTHWSCEEPAISCHSHHVSLVQWTNPLLPITRDLGSNPWGGTYVKPGFSC